MTLWFKSSSIMLLNKQPLLSGRREAGEGAGKGFSCPNAFCICPSDRPGTSLPASPALLSQPELPPATLFAFGPLAKPSGTCAGEENSGSRPPPGRRRLASVSLPGPSRPRPVPQVQVVHQLRHHRHHPAAGTPSPPPPPPWDAPRGCRPPARCPPPCPAPGGRPGPEAEPPPPPSPAPRPGTGP